MEEGARERILKQRRALIEPDLEAMSGRVCVQIIAALQGASLAGVRVALYSALPDELRIGMLATWLAGRGARLHFPRISDRKGRLMEFVELSSDQNDSWELGPYGIREPKAHLPAVGPQDLDLLFVPGVGFTETGRRIGMGAGFYDRYLPQTRRDALRVGLAFDFQVVSVLEQNPWDQPVHWVLTETRDLRVQPSLIEKLTGSQ